MKWANINVFKGYLKINMHFKLNVSAKLELPIILPRFVHFLLCPFGYFQYGVDKSGQKWTKVDKSGRRLLPPLIAIALKLY